MHYVFDQRKAKLSRSVPADRIVNGVPVFYFQTYIGAAIKAFNAKLLSQEAVVRVAKQAFEELSSLSHNQRSPSHKRLQRMDFQHRWNDLIQDANSFPPLQPLAREMMMQTSNQKL